MKPYIHLSKIDFAYSGIRPTAAHYGYHAFFVTYIPFIPSFLSEDFTRLALGRENRISLIVSRQIRLLNDLCSVKSDSMETFDLRFVSRPDEGQPYNSLDIFFIGKVFSSDQTIAKEKAIQLWEKFISFFPLEDPFNYPLRTISVVKNENGEDAPSQTDLLNLALNPFSLEPDKKWKIIEIRKYEDHDPLLSAGSEDVKNQYIGYFPHSFRPTLDMSAMSRFLETFTKQNQTCIVSICLRPTSLLLQEQQHIHRMIDRYAKLKDNASEQENWIAPFRQERLNDIVNTFDPIINQRNHLFEFKIQILGSTSNPEDVAVALGSEIMNNSTKEPRMWQLTKPETQEEEAIAKKNFLLMEIRPWKMADPYNPLWRISSLVTSVEAVGAFRLPIPPESGHLPGIKVRDEPFVTPAELVTHNSLNIKSDVVVRVGKIIHRGLITETDYTISLSQLKRHGLISGSTGSGKTNTCLLILTELWKRGRIPFLVIYPIDKTDYRLLAADKDVRDDLLIFTLGDETTSPFSFNPLYVPKGILIRTYISYLMRTFSAGFSMWDPLPAIYRGALRKLYEEAGYKDLNTAKGGDTGTTTPLLSRFYEILVSTAEEMTKDYGREAKGNIKQGSEIRIRDLLQNTGSVLNAREGIPWEIILKHPTVMEIGRVGSSDDSALIMGFLLMSLSSYLTSRKLQNIQGGHHITLIEEAHRLMSSKSSSGNQMTADPRAKASEDFANILAEVRGFNESILIAEQIPTELVSGAIGNTYFKVMHWLEEQKSFDLFSDLMNLNRQQRDYARTLPTGQAIVRGVNAKPILVQINNYLDQFQNPDDSAIIDDSDNAVKHYMKNQFEKWDINISPPINSATHAMKTNMSQNDRLASSKDEQFQTNNSDWIFSIPMRSCIYCEYLKNNKKCKYLTLVKGTKLLSDSEIMKKLEPLVIKLLENSNVDMVKGSYLKLREKFFDIVRIETPHWTKQDDNGYFFCFLAYLFNNYLETGQPDNKKSGKVIGIWKFVLKLAQSDYQQMSKND